jgi:hypothetical protein
MRHIKVLECKRGKNKYYTVVNALGTHDCHAHCTTENTAVMICRRAAELYVPAHYSTFLKKAILRVLFGVDSTRKENIINNEIAVDNSLLIR